MIYKGVRDIKVKTHQKFIQEVYNLVGNEYEILGKYKGAHIKVKIKHNICNHVWDISPNNFIQGRRCPKCSKEKRIKKRRKGHNQFIEELYNLVNNEYMVLTNYINSKTKVLIKHNICNHEWWITPNLFLAGRRCPKCAILISKKKRTKTHEEFIEQVYNLTNNEYIVLSKYKGIFNHVLFKHILCGHEWFITPNNFLNHNERCPNCCGNVLKTTEQFKNEVYNLVKDEYSVLNSYINARTYILMKHNICNNTYNIIPDSFLRGTRCPICNESKGEQKVRCWLENRNIKFKPQYIFNDLKDKTFLRFDFGILDRQDILIFLVEYDGIGHYDKNAFGEESYKLTIYHDQLKNQYCQKNNIPLLRIPYWDFDNIENILEEYINKLNIIYTSYNT